MGYHELSPGGQAALEALAEDELKEALISIGMDEYDPRVRGFLNLSCVECSNVRARVAVVAVSFADNFHGLLQPGCYAAWVTTLR